MPFMAAVAQQQQWSGQLLIGPTCAGPEREGQTCPSVPYTDITVQLLRESGAVAGQAVSDGRGRFLITAAPGRYRVQVMAPKVIRCPSPDLELPFRAAKPLVIDCDSGRR